jgi:hypothetical protein
LVDCAFEVNSELLLACNQAIKRTSYQPAQAVPPRLWERGPGGEAIPPEEYDSRIKKIPPFFAFLK